MIKKGVNCDGEKKSKIKKENDAKNTYVNRPIMCNENRPTFGSALHGIGLTRLSLVAWNQES